MIIKQFQASWEAHKIRQLLSLHQAHRNPVRAVDWEAVKRYLLSKRQEKQDDQENQQQISSSSFRRSFRRKSLQNGSSAVVADQHLLEQIFQANPTPLFLSWLLENQFATLESIQTVSNVDWIWLIQYIVTQYQGHYTLFGGVRPPEHALKHFLENKVHQVLFISLLVIEEETIATTVTSDDGDEAYDNDLDTVCDHGSVCSTSGTLCYPFIEALCHDFIDITIFQYHLFHTSLSEKHHQHQHDCTRELLHTLSLFPNLISMSFEKFVLFFSYQEQQYLHQHRKEHHHHHQQQCSQNRLLLYQQILDFLKSDEFYMALMDDERLQVQTRQRQQMGEMGIVETGKIAARAQNHHDWSNWKKLTLLLEDVCKQWQFYGDIILEQNQRGRQIQQHQHDDHHSAHYSLFPFLGLSHHHHHHDDTSNQKEGNQTTMEESPCCTSEIMMLSTTTIIKTYTDKTRTGPSLPPSAANNNTRCFLIPHALLILCFEDARHFSQYVRLLQLCYEYIPQDFGLINANALSILHLFWKYYLHHLAGAAAVAAATSSINEKKNDAAGDIPGRELNDLLGFLNRVYFAAVDQQQRPQDASSSCSSFSSCSSSSLLSSSFGEGEFGGAFWHEAQQHQLGLTTISEADSFHTSNNYTHCNDQDNDESKSLEETEKGKDDGNNIVCNSNSKDDESTEKHCDNHNGGTTMSLLSRGARPEQEEEEEEESSSDESEEEEDEQDDYESEDDDDSSNDESEDDDDSSYESDSSDEDSSTFEPNLSTLLEEEGDEDDVV